MIHIKQFIRALNLSFLLYTSSRSLTAHQEPTPSPPFRATVATIVVDIIIRNSKNKPITTLRKKDFELLENGIRQDIEDLTIVMPNTTASSNNNAARAKTADRPIPKAHPSSATTTDPSFLAIVFDRLTPNARLLAYKEALTYLDTLHENDIAEIFLSDIGLTTIQPYTNDRTKLRTALHNITNHTTSIFDRTATRDIKTSSSTGNTHPSIPIMANTEFVEKPIDNRSDLTGEVVSHQQTIWEVITHDQQGYTTTNTLLAITTTLSTLPKCKNIVFFAENLSIPDAVLPHFKNVISNTNHGNINVYTINTTGLRVHNKDAETGREIRTIDATNLTVNLDNSNQSEL